MVLFIGDGMGPTTVTAARVLKGQEKGNSGPEESLAWDRFHNVALSKVMVARGGDENACSSYGPILWCSFGQDKNSRLKGLDALAMMMEGGERRIRGRPGQGRKVITGKIRTKKKEKQNKKRKGRMN